jgi:hypothetical protein
MNQVEMLTIFGVFHNESLLAYGAAAGQDFLCYPFEGRWSDLGSGSSL